MYEFDVTSLIHDLHQISSIKHFGKVAAIDSGGLKITGLLKYGKLGDRLLISSGFTTKIGGEIVALNHDHIFAITYEAADGLSIGDRVELVVEDSIRPDNSWSGRIVDAFAAPLDGKPLRSGPKIVPLKNRPPAAISRGRLGGRLNTGLAVFNTVLPLAQGQRIGIFSGSGVGKSTLLGQLARGVSCDIVVLALIGERGRELRDFTDSVLGPAAMSRCVLVVATSDQAPLIKRRAAWTATAIAEYFRDCGKHVLLIIDSITRFAEAHREIALAAGEKPSLSAYPPSTANLIAALAERSGPGLDGTGYITAIMSVLVAGSDMEEPVADIVRGTLDGHIILERTIAERGRFPAVDVRRSVSRALPRIASSSENETLAKVRKILGTYYDAEILIQSGLYVTGSNTEIDRAIAIWPKLDAFFSEIEPNSVENSYSRLNSILTD